jgi:hypothetical protein
MDSAPHKADSDRGGLALVAGRLEGYFALLLTALFFLGPRVDHPDNRMVIVSAVYVGVVYGLALGGLRFGRGGSRLAAQIALGVLSLLLLAVVARSIARWEQVLWYWRQ